MENYILSLQAASKKIMIADHMIYITFPIVREKRFLIKILDEIHLGILGLINAILQYEYAYKRIVLYKDAKMNFDKFKESSVRFGISSSDIDTIIQIFTLIEKHKQSPMEFIRRDKFVILSNNLNTDIITLEKLKIFLLFAKDMFKKTENIIKFRK